MSPCRMVTLLVAATMASAHARAQTAPPAVTPLDAVTATATRTPEVAGDAAAPLSVVPREEMLRRQPQNLDDVLRFLPGVEADGLPRNTVMQPQIRGLGDDRVVVRIDGVRQNFNSGHRGRLFLDPELLRQVDVLRGPGSLLYGSGALGGVVALRTVEADDLLEPGRSVTALGLGGFQGANQQWRLGSMAAVRAGRFDGVIGAVGRSGRNFRDGAGESIPYSAADSLSGLAKLGWTPAEGIRLGLSAIGFGEDATIPIAANTTDATNIADRELRQHQFALSAQIAPPARPLLDLAATLYYTGVAIEERRILPADSRRDTTDLSTIGIDLQNTARFSLFGAERHALTIGLDAFRDEQTGRRSGGPRPQFPDAEQTIVGLFVQNQVALGPVTLTAGLRFDRYEQSAAGQRDRSDSRLSPKASLAWQVTDWLAPYVAYAEAFRAPSLSELYATGVHFPVRVFPPPPVFNFFVPNPDLRPEVARNREIGVNLRFRNVLTERDSLRARVSAFQNDIDDFIELIVTTTTTEARNASKARIRGIEAELGYDGGAWFGTLIASALRGENRTESRPLSLIPAHKIGLTAGRRFLAQGLVIGGRVLAVDAQDRKPFTSRETPGYGLIDLFASWQPVEGPLQGWRLDVGIDNLLDHAYRRLSWDSGPTAPDFYDVGRNIKLALRAQF